MCAAFSGDYECAWLPAAVMNSVTCSGHTSCVRDADRMLETYTPNADRVLQAPDATSSTVPAPDKPAPLIQSPQARCPDRSTSEDGCRCGRTTACIVSFTTCSCALWADKHGSCSTWVPGPTCAAVLNCAANTAPMRPCLLPWLDLPLAQVTRTWPRWTWCPLLPSRCHPLTRWRASGRRSSTCTPVAQPGWGS
jgi:hypothetical protein